MADIMVDMPDIAADILVDIIWELPCPQVRSSRILSSWVGRCFGRYYLRELPLQVAKPGFQPAASEAASSNRGSTPASQAAHQAASWTACQAASWKASQAASWTVVLDFCQAGSANILVDII